jgi:hypothetical protein
VIPTCTCTPTALDLLMRQILAELELCGNGSISRVYNPTAAAENATGAPGGDSHPPHVYWRLRYADAATDVDKRAVAMSAMADLRAIKGVGSDPAERQRQARLDVGRDYTRSAAVIAAEHGISVREVRRRRAEARAADGVRDRKAA